MLNLGKVKPGSTQYIPFDTFGTNGESLTMSGLLVGDIKIYKDGGVTERASTSGFTLLDTDGIDFDALTGIHGVSINLADNTTAGFYAAGSKYFVVIDSITVNTQTVRFIAAAFEIAVEGAVLSTTIATLATQTSFTLTDGPAEDDALNGCVMYAHDVASAVQGGYAYVSDYTGATKTVTLVAGPTFTMAATDNVGFFPPVHVFGFGGTAGTFAAGRPEVNTSHVGGTIQTAGDIIGDTNDIQARLPAALVGGRIDANMGAISADSVAADNAESFFDGTGYAGTNNVIPTVTTLTGHTAQTGDSFARIGAAGAGLTAVPWNASWDAEVQSEAEDALVVHRLDELLNADSDIDGVAPPTVGSVFHELMTKTAGSFTYDQTTDSLEAVRDRGDAAWITATGFSTHSAADVWSVATRVLTAGTNLNNLSAAEVLTQVNAAIDTAITELGVAAPTATPTLRTGLMLLYMALRNKSTTTATEQTISNNAGTTITKAALSDDGTTFERAELATG